MEIRILEPRDVAAYQALRIRAVEECPSSFVSTPEEERDMSPDARLARVAPSSHGCIFGAFDGAELVGVTGLRREVPSKLAHKAMLWDVYVAPGWRRKGIGRALVLRALAHARTMDGLRQVTLGVNAANVPAHDLYVSLGFTSFGLATAFMLIDGIPHDELYMALVLPAA